MHNPYGDNWCLHVSLRFVRVADVELLTTSEVARRLRVSVATVNRYAREGLLRAVVLPGGQRRFAATDIEALATPVQAASEPTKAAS